MSIINKFSKLSIKLLTSLTKDHNTRNYYILNAIRYKKKDTTRPFIIPIFILTSLVTAELLYQLHSRNYIDMGVFFSKHSDEQYNDTSKPLLKQRNSLNNSIIPDYTLLDSEPDKQKTNSTEIAVPTELEDEPLFVEFQLLASDVDLRLFRKRNTVKKVVPKDEIIKESHDERISSDYVVLIDDIHSNKQKKPPLNSNSKFAIDPVDISEMIDMEEKENRSQSILLAKSLVSEEQERRINKEVNNNNNFESEQRTISIIISNNFIHDNNSSNSNSEMNENASDLTLRLEEEERNRRISENNDQQSFREDSNIVNNLVECERQRRLEEFNIEPISPKIDVKNLVETERKRRISILDSNTIRSESKVLVVQLAEEERVRRINEIEFNKVLEMTLTENNLNKDLPQNKMFVNKQSFPEELVEEKTSLNEYSSLIEIQRNLLQVACDKINYLNYNSIPLTEIDYLKPITETYFDLVPMPLSELPEEFYNDCLKSDLFAAKLRLRMLIYNQEVRLECDDEIDIFEENLFFQRLLINDKVNRIIAEQYEYEPILTKPLEMWTTVMIEFAFNKVNDALFLSLNVPGNESISHRDEVYVGSIIGVLDPVIDDFVFQDFESATEFLRLYDEALEKKITYKNGLVAAKKNSAVAHLASKFASRRVINVKSELDSAIKTYNDLSAQNLSQIESLNARAKSVYLMVSKVDMTYSYYLSLREMNCWVLDNKLFEQKDFDIRNTIDNSPYNFVLLNVENDKDLLNLTVSTNGVTEMREFKATIENIQLLLSYFKDYARSAEELQVIRESLSKVENESKKIVILQSNVSILEEEFKLAEINSNLKKELFKEAELKIRDLELIYKTQITEQKFLNDKRRKLQLARTNIYSLIAKGENKKKYN